MRTYNYCQFDKCTTQPYFNFPNQKQRLYCSVHKQKNMINLIAKKCNFDGCIIQPSFNIKHKKSGIYCFKHKETNMINVRSRLIASNIAMTTMDLYYRKKNNYFYNITLLINEMENQCCDL